MSKEKNNDDLGMGCSLVICVFIISLALFCAYEKKLSYDYNLEIEKQEHNLQIEKEKTLQLLNKSNTEIYKGVVDEFTN